MTRWISAALVAIAFVLPLGAVENPRPSPHAVELVGPLPAPLPLFPPSNWWNLDISLAPLDPASDAFIAFIGADRALHPDLGRDVAEGGSETYGMPYVVVDDTQPKVAVSFLYSDESDGVDHDTDTSFPFYPIPSEAITTTRYVEGGAPGNVDLRDSSDRHLLIVDRDNRLLYELYNVWYDGAQWYAGSGAFFDMKTNERRPEGWTSADAAGLAILPGLIRYDEVYGTDEIRHAFRVTLRDSNSYVFPASHSAGSNASALPMGARLRLKASVDISSFVPEMQKVFRAMKKYGLIMADNGSDMYITGTYDNRWDNDVLNPAFGALTATDFEVVRLGWNPPSVRIAGVTPDFGPAAGGTLVSIGGSGFETDATVTLGGAALNGAAITATAITGATAAHPAGNVEVSIANPDGGSATLANAFTYTSASAAAGDVNGDGTVDVLDIVYLINNLFAGGPHPIGDGDADGDGSVDVNDIFFLINHLFAGGVAPA